MSMADEARARPPRNKKPKKKDSAPKQAKTASPKKTSQKTSQKINGERFKTPPQPEPSSDITDNIITAAAAVVLVVCLVILGIYVCQIIEAKVNHDKLSDIYENASGASLPELEVILPEETSSAPSDNGGTETSAESGEDEPAEDTVEEAPVVREPLRLLPAASELLAINSDTVGYVRIPGVLDEAVVQTSDNDFYLTHNFYGSRRQCGTVFADHRNNVNDYPDLMSDNIILYGHNQRDGTMFGNMDYYRWDPAYWLKNPFIYFNTNYEEGVYVIIASFVTNAVPEDDNGNIFDYWNYIDLSSEEVYNDFINEITVRSTIITGADVRQGDKFLTLSTCSTEWDDSRHAIVARRLRDGETEADIDITAFQKNPNPKWPAIYYRFNGGTYVEDTG